MKNAINSLEDALTLELENLYRSEEKLKKALAKMLTMVRSEELLDTLIRYGESSDLKLLKLERVFSYLNHEPRACQTKVIDELIDEAFDHLKFTQDQRVRELIMVNCFERITNYKVCAYESCLQFAEELELETASDLLLTIVQWEEASRKELMDLSHNNFNRSLQRV